MINNLIAFRILAMLVTPFNETQAYKLGIIDEEGKLLKPLNTLRTLEEKDAYDMLHRLVFNLKRLLGKVPGGKTRLASYTAAYFLVKENLDNEEVNEVSLEEDFNELLSKEYFLIEETIDVLEFLRLVEEGAVANVTGAAVSTDQPKIDLKKKKKFKKSVIIP